jgi:hypothetical protein
MERVMFLTRNGGVTRLTLAPVLLGTTLSLASAHGPAEWIQRGGHRNAAGELCCGERDCAEIAGEDVNITGAGYFVRSISETVPFSEALPSPDGHYWRCLWGGARKCFFAPPPLT